MDERFLFVRSKSLETPGLLPCLTRPLILSFKVFLGKLNILEAAEIEYVEMLRNEREKKEKNEQEKIRRRT